jgi:hypothetical protein
MRWISGRLCIFEAGVPVVLELAKLRTNSDSSEETASRFVAESLHVAGFKTGQQGWLHSLVRSRLLGFLAHLGVPLPR